MNIVDDIRLKMIEQIEATGVTIDALVLNERAEGLLLDEISPQPRTRERLPRGGWLWGVRYYLRDDKIPDMATEEILFYTAPSLDHGFAIESATAMMVKQREKGICKYGVSIEAANLSVPALIQHAREEAVDLSVYLAQLEETNKNMASDVRAALVDELLAHPMLKLTKEQRVVLAGLTCSANAVTLYVQPSELAEWQATDRNLLTVSRNNTFPFTLPLTMVMR